MSKVKAKEPSAIPNDLRRHLRILKDAINDNDKNIKSLGKTSQGPVFTQTRSGSSSSSGGDDSAGTKEVFVSDGVLPSGETNAVGFEPVDGYPGLYIEKVRA